MKQYNKFLIIVLLVVPIGCINTLKNDRMAEANRIITELYKSNKGMNVKDNCVFIKELPSSVRNSLQDYIKKDSVSIESDGYHSTYDGAEYRWENVIYAFPVASYWLKKRGYEVLSDAEFTERMKKIFGVEVDKSVKIYGDLGACETAEMDSEGYYYIRSNTLFLNADYNIIFRINERNNTFIEKVGEDEYAVFFPENLYHYNKYLLNDERASLTWLIHNDMDFLITFVKKFGYDSNPKINQVVLDSIYARYHKEGEFGFEKDPKLYNNLFARKNDSGRLEIREGLLKTIVETTTMEETQNLTEMNHIGSGISLKLSGLLSGEPDSPTNLRFSGFDNEELLQLLAYLCYYDELTFNKYNILYGYSRQTPGAPEAWPPVKLLYEVLRFNRSMMVEHLKKHNYYDLPNYLEMKEKVLVQIKEDYEDGLIEDYY